MAERDLVNKFLSFLRSVDCSDGEALREAFHQAMEEWEPGQARESAAAQGPPPSPAMADSTNIKDLFFAQLRQVAQQLGSAGKEAFSQMGSIKKDFKEKVKFTEGTGNAPKEQGEDGKQ